MDAAPNSPAIPESFRTVLWGIEYRLGAIMDRLRKLDHNVGLLTDGLVEMGAKINRIDDRTDALEDLEARINGMVCDNSPPPTAKPAHTVTPKQEPKPARRVA